ncbi:unnamed protein product [Zymoseptoria tritici ST99CH_3D7]|uniref:Uncharacterized protein n=3 Tax=Zymoseptoria tritici TaxID=1047171 RepID=F9XNW6_ZYMTI|nr:uncharacterized protein MYCGRDRAFT_77482 [Zymoseptoria tritici IPO323]EGP82943.1 hypothetical protein MYCGRDRAFT_77482 [Zymoseptoria tritici IPO323]SMQ55803.1 unnamed protein product [Zymoseptoria tritici ST99CH_3D7]SMR60991.1 unnamed protein product [Zymoseptoria tritici ST99CH_1E4]
MALPQRARAGTVSGPHSISLKVLRLSRPTLAVQTPLLSTAFNNGLDIPAKASLAYPSADQNSTFPLTPLLTLPASFGAAYVGERFTCTLCVNNELLAEDKAKSVSGLKVSAELQTPTFSDAGVALELKSALTKKEEDLSPGDTLQYTLSHELKEEGPHVLAVTVSYTETSHTAEGGASGGRARTFRKLYQFVAQPLLAVRSKITERQRREKDALRQWILEAQLENVGEVSVVLERVWLKEEDGMKGQDVNDKEAVVLKPSDVEQVMFLVEEEERLSELSARVPLGELNVDWRSAMGERGGLTTGTLSSRPR